MSWAISLFLHLSFYEFFLFRGILGLKIRVVFLIVIIISMFVQNLGSLELEGYVLSLLWTKLYTCFFICLCFFLLFC